MLNAPLRETVCLKNNLEDRSVTEEKENPRLVVDIVKEEVAILRMDEDDVVAVFLKLSMELADSAFKL